MEFLLKDDVVERLVDLLYDLQYEENPVLPRLESQLAERGSARRIRHIPYPLTKNCL